MKTYSIENFLKHSSELATISPAAVELINKINLPNIRRDEIARLVSADEIIYANVFKTTSSAAFGLNRKPRDVNEAIDILGVNELRNIVFAVAAKKVFVDLDLWHKSVFTALAAQRIAQKANLEQTQISNIYIAGLMQSIGTLVFKMFYKKEYQDIEVIKKHRRREAAEEDLFGISSSGLAYEIVKDFGLPESIVDIIKTQGFDPDSPNFKRENAILDLALSLSEINKDSISDQMLIDKAIDFKMLARFELFNLDITPEFLDKLHQDTDNFVRL